MDTNYNFEEEWPEDVRIEWWAEGRKKLNSIIRPYNEWQINGFNKEDGKKLYARIEYGIQTFAQRDGGGEWLATLVRMQEFVKSRIDNNEVA